MTKVTHDVAEGRQADATETILITDQGRQAAVSVLKESGLVAERRRINSTIRQQTFQCMDRNGFTYIPSESNCFMVDVKRPGQDFRDAIAKENVFVGRVWPIMPTYVRITVGTEEEMARFQSAFQKVMKV